MTNPKPIRWSGLRRSGLVTALVGLLAGFLAVAPAPAQAHNPPFDHCTPAAGLGDIHVAEDPGRWMWVFRIHSVDETFLKSEGRFAQNLTGTPQTVTFTSSVATTFSMSSAFSFSVSVEDRIANDMNSPLIRAQFGFTRTVTRSTTTTIGVNVAATVPPMSTVQGDYGVRGLVFWVDMKVYHKRQCWLQGQTGIFPITMTTVDQGWQVSVQPLPANTPTVV